MTRDSQSDHGCGGSARSVPRRSLGGVLPVISTPFSPDGDVDGDVLRAEIDWLLSCGVDGVTIAMVSEVFRLSDLERRELTEAVSEIVAGRVPVIASVGAETTKGGVDFAHHATAAGAAAVMAMPPLTVALPDAEILLHYQALIDAVEVPVVVQDASGYLGRPLAISLYIELLDRYGPERVMFKPEAPPIGQRLSELRDASGHTARVFEGTGGVGLVDSYRRGIVGTMPGPEVAWAIVALWAALERGDQEQVDAINGPLAALISLQTSIDSFIAVEKHLLVQQGVFVSDKRRDPNGYQLDEETAGEAERLCGLLRVAADVVAPS